MGVLATFTKQPNDEQDYDIDFSEYCNGFTPVDSLMESPTVTADSGLTITAVQRSDNVVKVWTSGGIHGMTYKITCRVSTLGGRVKEGEIKIKVKET